MAVIDLAQLERELTETADRVVEQVLVPMMAQATLDVEEAARRNVSRVLAQRSRALFLSIRSELTRQAEGVVGVISAGGEANGLDVPYARLHEYGGHIEPVNGKYLTIPTDKGLTGPGIARYQSVRHMPYAKWIPIQGKDKLRFIVVDKRNDELFYYVVTDVDVPARPYLRPALERVVETLPDRMASAMAQAVAP